MDIVGQLFAAVGNLLGRLHLFRRSESGVKSAGRGCQLSMHSGWPTNRVMYDDRVADSTEEANQVESNDPLSPVFQRHEHIIPSANITYDF